MKDVSPGAHGHRIPSEWDFNAEEKTANLGLQRFSVAVK